MEVQQMKAQAKEERARKKVACSCLQVIHCPNYCLLGRKGEVRQRETSKTGIRRAKIEVGGES